jgi:hypothetical protein
MKPGQVTQHEPKWVSKSTTTPSFSGVLYWSLSLAHLVAQYTGTVANADGAVDISCGPQAR